MVIHQVRGYDFVHWARNFDRQITVHQKCSRFRAFHVSQLCLDDNGREVLRCVVGDSGWELPVFAVQYPGADQGWHRQKGSIVQMRRQQWKTKWRMFFVDWRGTFKRTFPPLQVSETHTQRRIYQPPRRPAWNPWEDLDLIEESESSLVWSALRWYPSFEAVQYNVILVLDSRNDIWIPNTAREPYDIPHLGRGQTEASSQVEAQRCSAIPVREQTEIIYQDTSYLPCLVSSSWLTRAYGALKYVKYFDRKICLESAFCLNTSFNNKMFCVFSCGTVQELKRHLLNIGRGIKDQMAHL